MRAHAIPSAQYGNSTLQETHILGVSSERTIAGKPWSIFIFTEATSVQLSKASAPLCGYKIYYRVFLCQERFPDQGKRREIQKNKTRDY